MRTAFELVAALRARGRYKIIWNCGSRKERPHRVDQVLRCCCSAAPSEPVSNFAERFERAIAQKDQLWIKHHRTSIVAGFADNHVVYIARGTQTRFGSLMSRKIYRPNCQNRPTLQQNKRERATAIFFSSAQAKGYDTRLSVAGLRLKHVHGATSRFAWGPPRIVNLRAPN